MPGLRVDDYHLVPGIDRQTAEPRLMVRSPLGETLTVKGSAGLFHQPPASFLNLPAMDLTGLQFGLQEGVQLDLGTEWEPLRGFQVNVDG